MTEHVSMDRHIHDSAPPLLFSSLLVCVFFSFFCAAVHFPPQTQCLFYFCGCGNILISDYHVSFIYLFLYVCGVGLTVDMALTIPLVI